MDDEQERVKEEGAEISNISGYIYTYTHTTVQCRFSPTLEKEREKRRKKHPVKL